MPIRVLNPTQEPELFAASMAPRQRADQPLTLGLLSNSKTNADALLRTVAAHLSESFAIRDSIERRKPLSSTNATDALLDDLADRCDVAVVAIGD